MCTWGRSPARVVNGLLEIALHYDYLGYAGSQRGRLYWCLWGGGQGLAAVTAPCGYTQDTRKTHARHTQDTRKTHARRPLFVAK